MADELRMALAEVLRKAGVEEADFLREGVRCVGPRADGAGAGRATGGRAARPHARSGRAFELDGVAECFEAVDQPTGDVLVVALVEVVRTEISVLRAVG